MRAILIHGIDDIRAVLTAALPLNGQAAPPLLVSIPGAGLALGAGWWRALQDAMDASWDAARDAASPGIRPPLILDCADAAGRALEALAAGVRHVALDDAGLAPGVWLRVAAIASARGATLHPAAGTTTGREPPLDLRGARDPVAACRAWLTAAAHDGNRSGNPHNRL